MSEDEDTYRPPGWLEAATSAWTHRVANSIALLRVLLREATKQVDDKDELLRIFQRMEAALTEPTASIRELQNLVQLAPGGSLVPVPINSLLQELASDYSSRARSTTPPKIQLKLDPDVPAIKADPRLLREAIRNIIDNAVSATAQQPSGIITVTTWHRGDSVLVDIEDNGVGISEHLQPSLFQLGFSNRADGHGMGLFISKRLLQAWDGDIELFSANNNGTIFRITLSVWRIARSRGHHALVVEDSEAFSLSLTTLLRRRGISVDVAHTFTEAQRLLRAGAFDLMLLDVRLGDSDEADHTGLELARVARERNPQASVIVMSAYADMATVREAISVGADEFLNKASLATDELYLAIDRAASRRGTERESIRQGQLAELTYQTVSMMSHELRSPLLTIQRNAEALAAGALGALTPEQTDAIAEIQSATTREFVLLNAHLDLSRLEQGSERLNRREYDLVALVREEILAHRPEATRRGVAIRDILPSARATVMIDVNRFRVALNPLLDNAIKFSPDGKDVTVTGSVANEYAEVEIADHGPGMKHAEIERFLSPQSWTSKFSQRMRTSGLGLSMAKRMIEFHGGTLWIDSDGKSGTRVSFRLPVGVSKR